jgi:hypothetical protein
MVLFVNFGIADQFLLRQCRKRNDQKYQRLKRYEEKAFHGIFL